jgi:hypothetical protein
MDSDAMAFGAFLLVLGICVLVAAPTLAGGFATLESTAWQNEVIQLTFGGAISAAIGAALLAWGVGRK